jgi:hypothetical protein
MSSDECPTHNADGYVGYVSKAREEQCLVALKRNDAHISVGAKQ